MVKYYKKWEEGERKASERDFLQLLRDLGWRLITSAPSDDDYWVYQLTRDSL